MRAPDPLFAFRDPSSLSTHRNPERAKGSDFAEEVTPQGRFSLRALRIPDDIAIIHAWVTREYAGFWGLTGKSLGQVEEAYREIARTADIYLGFFQGDPAFLMESYLPASHPVGEHYPVLPGDRGMHLLVAPAESPMAGFTWAVFRVVMDFLFSDPAVKRIVVEPDIRNAGIHALNRRAGFRYTKPINLPGKTAHLAFCTRENFASSVKSAADAGGNTTTPPLRATSTQTSPISHLRPEIWREVNAALIRKAISEFAHERLLKPILSGGDGPWGEYFLCGDDNRIQYRFRARILALHHWDIQTSSLAKTVAGVEAPLDALEFVLEVKGQLGLGAEVLPVYLEEMTSTLYAMAYKRDHQALSAADLVHAGFQEIESAMTEGHPAFVANSGRVGFDANDYLAYAPETGAPIHLLWLAAHKHHAQFHGSRDSSYEELIREELGDDTVAAFRLRLEALNLHPGDYLFIPVHPWQWFNKLIQVFAADIANRDLVCLGYGEDTYRAQQSIRTFFNLSHPGKRYVKTALSVLNMGFMRGLSADYMRDTPAINDWIGDLIRNDGFFLEHGFDILREVGAIGYRSPLLDGAVEKKSPYRKMLAALWRENPVPGTRPGERLMTMAALLHRDRDGFALLPQLIQASNLDVDTWLQRYFRCYLAPLVHCFYAHDLAFMPHGENLILLLVGNAPVRAYMKDIAEEAVIMDVNRPLPDRVARIRADIPENIKLLSLFTDVFDGIFRYLAEILSEQAEYAEERFWDQVAMCLREYIRTHPEFGDKMRRHDLFISEFPHSCLNRLQLRNNRQMVDLTDPSGALQFAGTLKNPVGDLIRRD